MNFCADVIKHLNAIPVSRLSKPERRSAKGEKVIGRATPYLMQLHQLRIDMNVEANRVGEQARGVSEALAKMVPPDIAGDFDALRAFVNNDEVAGLARKKKELLAKFKPMKRAAQQVDAIFWHEVRVAFPEAEYRPCVYLNSDWQVCWEEEKEDAADDFLAKLAAMVSREGRD